jgi:hypothetical protein
VKSTALPVFWKCLDKLPPKVQQTARKNFKLWQQNPTLKSLGFKKIREDLWSVRAGSGFRALALLEADTYVWFWIGSHDDYEKLLRRTT